MGQYYKIYNKTKKQTLSPGAMEAGVKLCEFNSDFIVMGALSLLLANSNGRGGGDIYSMDKAENAEIQKMSGRWAGDQIVIQGDYAEEGDPGFVLEEELETYKDISAETLLALAGDEEYADAMEKRKNWRTGRSILADLKYELKKEK